AAVTRVERGVDVRVLEARNRVGGRVHSMPMADGSTVERGAEFILPGYSTMRALLAEHGLGLWDKGMRYGAREPRGIDVDTVKLELAYQMADEVLAAAGGEPPVSAARFLAELDIDGGAREVITARVEISAARPAGETHAGALAHLAAADPTPCPSVAGRNQLPADRLAD